jgi:predicted  nucleic acid-binding Zn ribbon protein
LYIAEIIFRLSARSDRALVRDAVEWLAGAWRKNGQVVGPHCSLIETKPCITLFLSLPERKSLANAHHNGWAKSLLRKIKDARATGPIVIIRGQDLLGPKVCKCRRHSSYILITNFLQMQSPLRCGHCFHSVPLYKLEPWRDGEFADVLWWESEYQACDRLYIDSGSYERFGSKQMSNLQCGLSKEGREICARIEKQTGKPVYYFLHKPSGRSHQKEQARRCPSCNKKWQLKTKWHDLFDFRCERCRLVSNIAWDVQ